MNQLPHFTIELLNSPTYILMRVAIMSGNFSALLYATIVG